MDCRGVKGGDDGAVYDVVVRCSCLLRNRNFLSVVPFLREIFQMLLGVYKQRFKTVRVGRSTLLQCSMVTE